MSVEIKGLEKHYGGFHALKNINLRFEPGEFVVMVGPSGCGKSTLLRTIAGLEDATEGAVSVNGRDITDLPPRDRGLAMVFQNYALYPHQTVRENMGFALKLAKRPKPEIEAAVQRAASILQIEPLLNKKPRHLSGGQRQRVAIGRAITRSPDVFLFDEPLSNLDASLRAQMRVELASLHASLCATMIYVTHDQVEAMTMADRIVLMRAGEVVQMGPPLDLYNRPINRFVAGFLGAPRINFFAAEVVRSGDGKLTVAAQGLAPMEIPLEPGKRLPLAGESVSFGLRPEDIRVDLDIGPGMPRVAARVGVEERLGRETVLYVLSDVLRPDEADQTFITIQRNVQSAYAAGAAIEFGFDPDRAILFDKQGAALRWPASSQLMEQ